MAVRLAQRSVDQTQPYWSSVLVRRAGVEVVVDDVPRTVPIAHGIGLVAWDFVIPVGEQSSTAWTFDFPMLIEVPNQTFGHVFVGGQGYPASLAAGVVSSSAPLVGGSVVSIRGTVTI